jgi:hypothetical protein
MSKDHQGELHKLTLSFGLMLLENFTFLTLYFHQEGLELPFSIINHGAFPISRIFLMVLSHQQFSFYSEGPTGHTGSVQLYSIPLGYHIRKVGFRTAQICIIFHISIFFFLSAWLNLMSTKILSFSVYLLISSTFQCSPVSPWGSPVITVSLKQNPLFFNYVFHILRYSHHCLLVVTPPVASLTYVQVLRNQAASFLPSLNFSAVSQTAAMALQLAGQSPILTQMVTNNLGSLRVLPNFRKIIRTCCATRLLQCTGRTLRCPW